MIFEEKLAPLAPVEKTQKFRLMILCIGGSKGRDTRDVLPRLGPISFLFKFSNFGQIIG